MTFWIIASALFLLQLPAPRLETGVISGVVRQADGKPAAGVRVAAMPADAANGADAGSTLVALAESDDSGNYRLENVPPGNYHIVAGRIGAPTFYPGTASVTESKTVTVTAGATISGIDFSVAAASLAPVRPNESDLLQTLQQMYASLTSRLVPTVQVAGRVVMEEGSQTAKIPDRLRLSMRSTSRLPTAAMNIFGASTANDFITPGADGAFTATLPSGEIRLSPGALPEGYSVKSMTSGGLDLLSMPVTVQQGMSEIVIVLAADLRPRYRVMGTVLNAATGRPLLGEHIELVPEAGAAVRVIIDAQGRFEFTRVLAGSYLLRVQSDRFQALEQRIAVVDGGVSLDLRATPR
jgi:hypothetical protein